jgi:hypothetical protein
MTFGLVSLGVLVLFVAVRRRRRARSSEAEPSGQFVPETQPWRPQAYKGEFWL